MKRSKLKSKKSQEYRKIFLKKEKEKFNTKKRRERKNTNENTRTHKHIREASD